MKKKRISLNPSQTLICIFLVLAVTGASLLKLPIATTIHISWLDALFTATSAFTVTGLGVVDTGTTFTLFGQIVILTLIQVGGLGYMTFAILIFMVLGKKISIQDRMLLQQSLNIANMGGILRLVRALFTFSLIIEFIGMGFLALSFVPEFGWSKGLYYSFFHSVSAFNNAGFALFPTNLMDYVGDPIVNITIASLITLGGIGFIVMVDIYKKRNWRKLSLQSKLMIAGTIALTTFATVFIFLLEHNKEAFQHLTLSEEILASFFQAVSLRTAGFNTVDIEAVQDGSTILMILYMFIGAGSGSTAGGIKLTTFLIIFLSVISYVRGKSSIVVFRKSIREDYVIKSLAIAMVSLTAIFIAILVLSVTEPHSLEHIIFEVFSAFGTVGLSMNLTPLLTPAGKLVIIFVMFIGKVGPITLLVSLTRPKKELVRYPSEDILTG